MSDDQPTKERRTLQPEEELGATIRVSGQGAGGLTTTAGGDRPEASRSANRIGRFRIVEEVGRGGQAIVYLARDDQLGRDVAIKVMQVGSQAPEVLKRFQREAAIVSGLDDHGICAVYDAGVSEGVAYIAMQFLRGPSLKDWLKQLAASGEQTGATSTEPLSKASRNGKAQRRRMDRILEVIERVARSLHTAHEAGVIHRDIKPANVMITEGDRPVIVDFGLAQATDHQFETLTMSGDLFGTPLYMSPEQVRGERMDARTDIYSLGVVLYEALTGERPHEAATREGLYRAILEDNAASLRAHRTDLSRDIEVIVATAMEKDLRRRYQTAADLADDIRRFRRHEIIKAKPVPAWFKAWRLCQRNPLATSLVALVFVLLFTGIIVTLGKNRDLELSRERSEQTTYVAQIAAAHAALQSRDAELLQQILAAVDPARRGWEWRHLKSRVPRPLASFDLGHAAQFALPVLKDDRFVWLGGGGTNLSLIDVETTEIVRRLDTRAHVRRFCPAPDGKAILLERGDNNVILIDPRSGLHLWPASVPGRIAESAAIAPGGREIVVRGERVVILDFATGATLRSFPLESTVQTGDFSFLNDDVLVERGVPLESQGGTFVALLDAHDGRLIRNYTPLGRGLKLEIDQKRGRMIVTSSGTSAKIAARDLPTMGGVATIIDAGDDRPILAGSIMPRQCCFVDAETIACLGAGEIERRNQQTGKLESHQVIVSNEMSDIVAACEGKRFVVYGPGSMVGLWPARSTPSPWFAPAAGGWDSDLDERGMRHAGTNWGHVHVADAHDGRFLWERNVAHRELRAIGFSPDGSSLALATQFGEFHLLEAATGKRLSTTRQPPRSGCDLRELAWTRDGREVLAAASNGLIVGWRPGDEKSRDIARLDRALRSLLPAADGQRLFVGFGPRDGAQTGGAIALLSVTDGRLLGLIEVDSPVTALAEAEVISVAKSKATRTIVVGDESGTLAIHDGHTLKLIARPSKVDSAILALDWAPEIERLLVGTKSGLLIIDVTTNAAVLKFKSEVVDDLHYLPARDAIIFTTSASSGAFGLLETDQDRNLTERRHWNTTVTRVALGVRSDHAILEDGIADLSSYDLPIELEEAVKEQLARYEESAAWFNSDAWAIGLPKGLAPELYARALRVSRIANERLPDTWSLMNTMSQLLFRCGRFDECLANIAKGLPSYRSWGREGMHNFDRLLRAMSLAQLGSMKEAREELIKSLAEWKGDDPAIRREALELIDIPRESIPESLRREN